MQLLANLDWFLSNWAWHCVAALFAAYTLYIAGSNYLAKREWRKTQSFVRDPERRATLDADRRRAREAQQRRSNEAGAIDARKKREKESKRILSLGESSVDEELLALRAAANAQSEHRRPNFSTRKQAKRGG